MSPKYTPQMARIDEIVSGFHPKPGVTYTALALNERGDRAGNAIQSAADLERSDFEPSTTSVTSSCGETQPDPGAGDRRLGAGHRPRQGGGSDRGRHRGQRRLGLELCAASSAESQRMEFLSRQKALWDAAGIRVTNVFFGDPMSWKMPHVVEQQLETIKQTWPEITKFHLHLHNGRGMAVPAIYAALGVLDERDKLTLDTTIGGMGGCPYCGNGRVTNMAPTEDIGADAGGDGHRHGRRPRQVGRGRLDGGGGRRPQALGPRLEGRAAAEWADKLYPIDMPFMETEEQARHFLLGPSAYGDNPISPWTEPIRSAQREAIDAELAAAARRATKAASTPRIRLTLS